MFRPFPLDRRPIRGFTLIELLVVVAILALLAAILFPVFGRVREKARASTCLSNLKQIATAEMQYCQDSDGYNAPIGGGTSTLNPNGDGHYLTSPSWRQTLNSYIENSQVFSCPDHNSNVGNADGAITSTSADITPGYGTYSAIPVSYAGTGYTMSTTGMVISGFTDPSTRLMIVEEASSGTTYGAASWSTCPSTPNSNWVDYWNGEVGGVPMVNDAKYIFTGHTAMLNYCFLDGHVKAMIPVNTATPYNMWGAEECVGGIPNVYVRANYNLPDPVIVAAMQNLQQLLQ